MKNLKTDVTIQKNPSRYKQEIAISSKYTSGSSIVV